MKKIVLIILVFILALSTSLCFASGETKLSAEASIVVMLGKISQNPDEYGMENVNFDNLKLGKGIPLYEQTNENLEINDSIEYYPIFENDKVVVIATKVIRGGKTLLSISRSLVDELNRCLVESNELRASFASIDDVLYYVSGDNIFKISDESNLENRANSDEIPECLFDEGIEGALIIPDVDSEYLDISQIAPRYRENSLNVSYVGQGNYGLCWAACVSCVGEYVTGTKYTPKQIADKMDIGYDDGATLGEIRTAYNSIYHLYATTTGYLSTSQIYGSIDSDRPVTAGFENGNEGHAIVVYGYYFDSTDCFVSYMEPNGYNGIANYMNEVGFVMSGEFAGWVMYGGIILAK